MTPPRTPAATAKTPRNPPTTPAEKYRDFADQKFDQLLQAYDGLVEIAGKHGNNYYELLRRENPITHVPIETPAPTALDGSRELAREQGNNYYDLIVRENRITFVPIETPPPSPRAACAMSPMIPLDETSQLTARPAEEPIETYQIVVREEIDNSCGAPM